jgi:hypothetical protein
MTIKNAKEIVVINEEFSSSNTKIMINNNEVVYEFLAQQEIYLDMVSRLKNSIYFKGFRKESEYFIQY